MKALVAAPGRPGMVELRDVDPPAPHAYEVVVAVEASSLNRGELRALAGAQDGWRPGWDVAGVVIEPAVSGWGPAAGTRVVGLVRSGGWAEAVAVETRALAPIPDDLEFETAATLPIAGLTALRTLALGGLTDGKRVLVTGASGGVGRFAVQLAAHAAADVTAVVGSAERGEGLPALGAQQVVVGMPERGEYDVILESVGGDSLAAALRLVAPDGCVVTFGNSSQLPTTYCANELYPKHQARMCGFMIFEEIEQTGAGVRDLRGLADLAAQHKLDCGVNLVGSWRDPEPLFRALLDRRLSGKAVMVID